MSAAWCAEHSAVPQKLQRLLCMVPLQFPGFQPRYHCDRSMAAAAKYAELARSKGLTLAQLALAWCKSRWCGAAGRAGRCVGTCAHAACLQQLCCKRVARSAASAPLANRSLCTLIAPPSLFLPPARYVASTIIGATDMQQLRENIAAFDLDLDAETLAAVDAIHLEIRNPNVTD